MSIILSDYPWMCLLPSMLTLVLAIATRRIILSIFWGICAAAILLKGISLAAIKFVGEKFVHVFYEEGQLMFSEINLLLFLWMMGVVTYMMSRSGSVDTFTNAILTRIKSRKGGQFFVIFLGLFIFIDDYLNSLVVGNVSRPICKRLGISKAKLAYLLDSTAAPVCVLVPLSSWGAAIIATLNREIQRFGLEGTSFSYFLGSIGYNFYPILTLLMLLLVVALRLDLSPMRKHEIKAMAAFSAKEAKGEKVNWMKALKVLLPIVALLVVCMISLFVTGKMALGGESASFISILSASNLEVSLLLGGMVSIIGCIVLFERERLTLKMLYTDFKEGLKIMMPVIVILIFSWVLSSLSKELQVGNYIVSYIQSDDMISLKYMPAIVFLIASIASFATGSSWGTFSLMLPIVFQIATNSDLTYLMPMLAACLGGGVFGDHCSPISDTTILSSIGAGCHHMDHVLTQLPYCLFIALFSLGCYILLALTGSALQALSTVIALLVLSTIGISFCIKFFEKKKLR